MIAKELEQMLTAMTRVGASSLHLIPGRSPCIRVQRQFVQSEHPPISGADVDDVLRDLLFQDHRQRLQQQGEVEVLYVARSGQRFRTIVMRQESGTAMLFRPVPGRPPQLSELDLPPQLESFAQLREGLVVIGGSFGSGRSTTLAALVDRLNQDTTRHIVTFEDPIEYLHEQSQALLHQREIGVHVGATATGVRQAVRLGADVVVVGDVEDGDTLLAALDAVESGCLVLAGFAASSVVGACVDLPLLVPADAQERTRRRFAAAMRAVAVQTLLPSAHRQGRVPMVEILMSNAAARHAIAAGEHAQLPAIMGRCRGLGMQNVDAALRWLLARHLISPEEAAQHATNRDAVLARGAAATRVGG